MPNFSIELVAATIAVVGAIAYMARISIKLDMVIAVLEKMSTHNDRLDERVSDHEARLQVLESERS